MNIFPRLIIFQLIRALLNKYKDARSARFHASRLHLRRMVHRVVSGLAALTLIGASSLGVAQAASTAYEFYGEWIPGPDQQTVPEKVESGTAVLGARWYLDINDSQDAPQNNPVNGNVVVFTLENAQFEQVPSTCQTPNGENPLSADKKTLTCNLGEITEGTAMITFASIRAQGEDGAEITMTGKLMVAGEQQPSHTDTVDNIFIQNSFDMDAKFDPGATQVLLDAVRNDPSSLTPLNDWKVSFPFSLSHKKSSAAGPESVQYEITAKFTDGRSIDLIPGQACSPLDELQPGYPFSAADPTSVADGSQNRTTRFPTCTLTKSPDKADTFILTLSGLDYTTPGPERDSNGQPLNPAYDVIAAGVMNFGFTTPSIGEKARGNLILQASTPEYQAVTGGQIAVDRPENNINQVSFARGGYTGGWYIGYMRPTNYPGDAWNGDGLAPVGATVMAATGIESPAQNHDNWACTTIDSEYLTLKKARVSIDGKARPNFLYGDEKGLDVYYYVGDLLDPNDGTPVDPNDFNCGPADPQLDPAGPLAVDGQPGWVLAPNNDPVAAGIDLSQVKAVKVRVPQDFSQSTNVFTFVLLVTESEIKSVSSSGTPVLPGQDIWTWSSTNRPGVLNDVEWEDVRVEGSAARKRWDRITTPGVEINETSIPRNTTLQTEKRYPYSSTMRDMITVVGSEPRVSITADKLQYLPQEPATFTVDYGLFSNLATPDRDDVTVDVVLPPGMTYVEGSSSTGADPVFTAATDTLPARYTWTFKDVLPNTDPLESFTFQATTPNELGGVYAIGAAATSQNITRVDQAQINIPNSGSTSLLVQTDQPTVDVDKEPDSAQASFDINLRSQDPNTSKTTDVIALIPASGDPRGSTFDGTLSLDKVEAPAGATVYYSTAPADSINEDPGDPSNANPGEGSLWSTTFTPQATAIRVIAGALPPGATQTTTVTVTLNNPAPGDAIVLSAVGRTQSTKLRMRSSAAVTFYDSTVPLIPLVPAQPNTPPGGKVPSTPTPFVPIIPITIPIPVPSSPPKTPRPSTSTPPEPSTPKTQSPSPGTEPSGTPAATPPSTAASPGSPSQQALAKTGANVLGLGIGAMAVIAVGGALLLWRRSSRSTR